MYTPGQMAQMGWGKVRRFFWPLLSPGSYRASLASREGSCTRCGACCHLLYRCPFLQRDHGVTTCSIQGRKPGNCVRFPIDQRDLADRDLVAPRTTCGYSFPAAAPTPEAP